MIQRERPEEAGSPSYRKLRSDLTSNLFEELMRFAFDFLRYHFLPFYLLLVAYQQSTRYG